MFSDAAKLCLSFAAASLLAGRSVRVALRRRPWRIQNGPWQTDLSLGSAKLGMYRRASLARHSPLALRSAEALYFVAESDSAGNKLRRGCTYSVVGRQIDSRWWSIAAYNNDRLIPNARNRYSYSETTVRRRTDGGWIIHFSPREQSENWLPNASEDGDLKLVLRCYGPSPQLLENPAAALLPQILPGLCL
jgi:hypothetical protein